MKEKYDISNLKELNERAEQLANEDKIDESVLLFNEILKLDPKNYAANLSMGNISYFNKDKHKAIKYYINAVKKEFNERDGVMNLCYTLLEVEKQDESQKIMDAYMSARENMMKIAIEELEAAL
ncbi:MAG: hypothetical protein B6I17_04135 [Tenericutes bacterium 4572_104]|nr:MAG: hypothetical protein B6I17_04135 [Tenericutes bacterium 4572_104]